MKFKTVLEVKNGFKTVIDTRGVTVKELFFISRMLASGQVTIGDCDDTPVLMATRVSIKVKEFIEEINSRNCMEFIEENYKG